MESTSKIIKSSFRSTRSRPRWWILAFVQTVSLIVVSALAKPKELYSPGLFWLAAFSLILVPATVGLWLEIDAVSQNIVKEFTAKKFFQKCLTNLGLMCLAIGLVILARFLTLSWVFLSIFSSFVAATTALAALYVALCDQKLVAALALAADTWHKKISLAALVALVIILGHAASFAVVHGFATGFGFRNAGFASFPHSATILILFVLTGFILAFCGALANCFLVNLFLQIINRKKDPEEAKSLERLIVSEAGYHRVIGRGEL